MKKPNIIKFNTVDYQKLIVLKYLSI